MPFLDPGARFRVGEHEILIVPDRMHHVLAHRIRGQAGRRARAGLSEVRPFIAAAEALGTAPAGIVQRRIHLRRAQHRNSDAAALQFHRQCLGQGDHAVLRHRVGADAGDRGIDLQARHRGGVDDVSALAVPADARHESLHSVDHAEQVDPEDPGKLGRRRLQQADIAQRDAGVVADNVYLAERRLHRIGRARDGTGVRHVQRQRDRAHAHGGDFRPRAFQRLRLDVGQRDVRAGARQRPADAQADAVCRARNECGLASDVLHVEPPRCVTTLRGTSAESLVVQHGLGCGKRQCRYGRFPPFFDFLPPCGGGLGRGVPTARACTVRSPHPSPPPQGGGSSLTVPQRHSLTASLSHSFTVPQRHGLTLFRRHPTISSAAGTRVTWCACTIGSTSRAKRRICSRNISCGMAPRLKPICTVLAPA